MTATLTPRPAHPDIDIDRAWKLRSRLYVSSGRHTRLRADLEALGAHWDTHRKAHWVGPAKQQTVLEAVATAEERAARYREVVAGGRWVRIPYEAELIRHRAKELGAVWVPDRRMWAAPSEEARAELAGLCTEWRAAVAAPLPAKPAAKPTSSTSGAEQRSFWAQEVAAASAERREREYRRLEEIAIAREQAAIDRRRDLVTDAGRITTGYHLLRAEASTEILTRTQADELAHRAGDILRLEDGRRAVVTDSTTTFVADVCPHASRHGQQGKHWCFRYRLDLVELTSPEIDDEARQGAETLDAHDIHQLVSWAVVATDPVADDHWSRVPADWEAGRITLTGGVAGQLPAGQLIVTHDDQVIWQDPGQYDTYIRAEGTSTDQGLLRWARAVLAAGDRTRVVPGPSPLHYTVRQAASDA